MYVRGAKRWKQAFEGAADVSDQCDVAVGVSEEHMGQELGLQSHYCEHDGDLVSGCKITLSFVLTSVLVFSSCRALSLGAAGAVLWGASADYRDKAMKLNQSTIILLSESAFR